MELCHYLKVCSSERQIRDNKRFWSGDLQDTQIRQGRKTQPIEPFHCSISEIADNTTTIDNIEVLVVGLGIEGRFQRHFA